MGLLGFFLGIVGLIGGVLYPYLFSLNILIEIIFLIISVIGFFTSIMGIKTGGKVSGAFGIIFSVIAIICCAALTFASAKVKDLTGLDFIKDNTPAVVSTDVQADDASAILGSWKYVSGDYTYRFNEDLTGTYTMGTSVKDFTYKVKDGKLSILYSGNTTPLELKYSIEGDTLNVIDSNGNDTLYKKK